MKTWNIILMLIANLAITNLLFAQTVITQPNGNVIANPNLRVIKKDIRLNPILLKNVTALKLSGKNTIEIVKSLKTEKVKAEDAFMAVKTAKIPDPENIGALCVAGYTLSEIIDALFVDGYDANTTVGLLKNSQGCSFSRPLLFKIIMSKYSIRLGQVVPIIKTNYTTNAKEIVFILSEIIPLAEPLLEAIGQNRLASTPAEICLLLKGRVLNFDKNHLGQVLRTLMTAGFGIDQFNSIADGFLELNATPIQALETFKGHYFTTTDVTTATKLALIAKHLNLNRDETATFLRKYTYTATQVLDALQAVYG